MKPHPLCQSACRHCRFFNPEGRRGGMCAQLGVLVKAEWKSCSLSVPAFETEWQPIPQVALLEKSFSLGCATPQANREAESLPVRSQEVPVLSEKNYF